MDCPGLIVSKFSGCLARTSPQQNWQELSKLQESLAGGGAGWGARPSTGLLRLCAPHSWSLAHFVNDYVAGQSTECSLYNSKSVSQVLTLSHLSDSPSLLSQEKSIILPLTDGTFSHSNHLRLAWLKTKIDDFDFEIFWSVKYLKLDNDMKKVADINLRYSYIASRAVSWYCYNSK